jgi:hypothetical protein
MAEEWIISRVLFHFHYQQSGSEDSLLKFWDKIEHCNSLKGEKLLLFDRENRESSSTNIKNHENNSEECSKLYSLQGIFDRTKHEEMLDLAIEMIIDINRCLKDYSKIDNLYAFVYYSDQNEFGSPMIRALKYTFDKKNEKAKIARLECNTTDEFEWEMINEKASF